MVTPGGVILKPTFRPPAPQSLRTISERDRIDLLVRMNHFRDQTDNDVSASDFTIQREEKSTRTRKSVRNQQSSASNDSLASTIREPETSTPAGLSTAHDVDSFFEAMNTNKSLKTTKNASASSMTARSKPANPAPLLAPKLSSTMQSPSSSRRVIPTKSVSEKETVANELFEPADFSGLGGFARNVGASQRGLDIFLSKIRNPQSVCAVSLLWTDLTSNHTGTSVKHCVPSARCTRWFCSCDRTVRAGMAYHDPLMALVTFADDSDALYMLPLLSSADSGASSRSQSQSLAMSQTSGGSNKVVDLSEVDSEVAFVTTQKIPVKSTVPVTVLWNAVYELLFKAPCRTIVYRSEMVYLALLGVQQRAAALGVQFDVQLRLADRNQYVQRSIQGTVEGVTSSSSVPSHTPVIGGVFDPRIAAYLCKSDISEQQLELASLGGLFAAPLVPFKSSPLCPIDHTTIGKVSLVIGECFMQLRSLLRMYMILDRQMERMSLTHVFHQIEMPLTYLLAQMEFNGVCISETLLNQTSLSVKDQIASVEEQVTLSTGAVLNLASSDQVATLLFDTLGLPSSLSISSAQTGHSSPNGSKSGTTATGKRPRHASTAEEDLLRIRALHPAVDLILSFRSLSKFLSTYVEGLRPFIISFTADPIFTRAEFDEADEGLTPYEAIMRNQTHGSAHRSIGTVCTVSKIHSVWNQTVVRTGRLSCCRPNLQSASNTQKVNGRELNCREFFLASTGCILVGADYSQIEVRLLAHLTRDPALLELFHASGDVYKNMAGVIFHKEPAQVDSKERDKAKTICLGVIYGMGVSSIANRLGITILEATEVLNSFFDRFKSVNAWIAQVKSQARIDGYVSTICGRRRYLESISSQDNSQRATSERQAVNSIIQGSASDVIKLAMILLHHRINHPNSSAVVTGQSAKLLMQIHDELIYEVPVPSNTANPVTCAAVQSFVESLRSVMERDVATLLSLTVPLPCTVSIGLDWGHMLTA